VCNFYISHSHLCAAPKVTDNLQTLLSFMSKLAVLSPMIRTFLNIACSITDFYLSSIAEHYYAATQEYYSSVAEAELQCKK
jgi:hypothetical protein